MGAVLTFIGVIIVTGIIQRATSAYRDEFLRDIGVTPVSVPEYEELSSDKKIKVVLKAIPVPLVIYIGIPLVAFISGYYASSL